MFDANRFSLNVSRQRKARQTHDSTVVTQMSLNRRHLRIWLCIANTVKRKAKLQANARQSTDTFAQDMIGVCHGSNLQWTVRKTATTTPSQTNSDDPVDELALSWASSKSLRHGIRTCSNKQYGSLSAKHSYALEYRKQIHTRSCIDTITLPKLKRSW